MPKSTTPFKALCVIGTRPEAIKMAPVVRALRKRGIHAPILATAQHRELLDTALSVFDLKTDWDLDAMRPNQGLSELFGRILPQIDEIIYKSGAQLVIAQGDTSTVFAAALAAYHTNIPFAHVEAGLRSGDLAAPFPEEGNRRLTDALSTLHFAPTETAKQALLMEGINPTSIHVVGNTVIDALLEVASREHQPWPTNLPSPTEGRKLALVTLHRRENFGTAIQDILKAISRFALENPTTDFVFPVHPNPHIYDLAHELLEEIPNFHLIAPLDYLSLVTVLKECYAVLTDSGGLQEEAPALGKPVLVFREKSERPEAIASGGVRLVGCDPERIQVELNALWSDSGHYELMARPRFPYGVGDSGAQIATILTQRFLS